jgi:transposase-like protein
MGTHDVCPHCDGPNVERMKDRSYEATSTNTWYECRDCRRMWSLTKQPQVNGSRDNDQSPEF